MVIISFVFLNLFVGVVLAEYQNFSNVWLTSSAVEDYEEKWFKHCDVTASFLMDVDKLEELVGELEAPLGFGGAPYSPQEMAARIGTQQVVMNLIEVV